MFRRGKKRTFIMCLSARSNRAFSLFSEEKKHGALTATLIIAVLLIAVGLLPRDVSAFYTDDSYVYWGYDVHNAIMQKGLHFLRDDIRRVIHDQNWPQDSPGGYKEVPRHHFVRSMFHQSGSYINEEYEQIQAAFSQQVPNVWYATERFGMLMHTVQDFYAHSNWVEIWRKRGYYTCDNDGNTPDRSYTYFLYEPRYGFWLTPDNWSVYPYRPDPLQANDPDYVDIMVAQTYYSDWPMYIPVGYTATLNRSSELPYRRVPEIVVVNATDGTSKKFDALETTAGGCSYEPIKLEHDGPDYLAKDDSDAAYYEDAYWNAVYQTEHEFWRAVNLTKGDDYRGSSAVLAYWLNPYYAKVPAFPTSVTATVSVTNLTVTNYDGDSPLGFAFVLYSGNFLECVKSESSHVHPGDRGAISSDELPASLTLHLNPSDKLVMSVQPWIDAFPGGGFNKDPTSAFFIDMPLAGATLYLNGENLQSGTYHLTTANVDAWLSVSITATPVAEAGGPYTGVEGTPVTFSAVGSSDFDGSITGYEWDLDGDGEYADGTGVTIDHTWVDDFTGTVGLRVTDNDGFSGTDTAHITIQNAPPTVEAGPDIATYPGQPTVVTGAYIDPGLADTHTFEIHWGDGFIDTGPASGGSISLDHVYSEANSFVVTLTVTDDDGGTGTDTLTVKVMTAEEGAQSLSDYIQDLNSDAFKNSAEQRKMALSAKMDVVIRLIEQEKYHEALDKLILNIRPKTDGFWGGDPSDDWITDSAVQQELLAKIDALVAYIQTLQ